MKKRYKLFAQRGDGSQELICESYKLDFIKALYEVYHLSKNCLTIVEHEEKEVTQ